MTRSNCISDYMVKSPVVAEGWQPISLIRHRMLADSFSFLPVLFDGEWKVVADYKLAKWLRTAPNDGERKVRLITKLDVARKMGLELVDPVIAGNEDVVSKVLANSDGRPILVVDKDRLLGIATPYDLL
jgi:CBS domain-containing protein